MPNISIPKIMDAITQCVAPANTATKPIAANKAKGRGINKTKLLPNVAPIKKSGVTSPPLNPTLKVKLVNNNLIIKSYLPEGLVKACIISGMPNPIYFVEPNNKITIIIMMPPMNGLKGL